MNVLGEALNKARKINRESLLKEKPSKPKNNKRILLVLTFNPANPNMNNIISKHWHLVEKWTNKKTFTEKPIVAYRRNKIYPTI